MLKSKSFLIAAGISLVSLVAFSLQTASALYKKSPDPVSFKVGLSTVSKVEITFQCTKDVGFGNSIYIAGTFNSWTQEEMNWTSGNVWEFKVSLDPGTVVEYKRIIHLGSTEEWEKDPNRTYTVPSTAATENVDFNKDRS